MPTRYSLKCLIGLTSCWPTGYNFPSFACNSTAAMATPDASVLRMNGFIRSGSFNTGSCIRYSLSSKHAPVPHSIVLVLTFLSCIRRTAELRSWQRLGCGIYSSPLIPPMKDFPCSLVFGRGVFRTFSWFPVLGVIMSPPI